MRSFALTLDLLHLLGEQHDNVYLCMIMRVMVAYASAATKLV